MAASTALTSEYRQVLGISLPSRAYAATLFGLGAVCRRAQIPSETFNDAEYYEFLKAFASGTPVTFLGQSHGGLRRFAGKLAHPGNDRWGDYLGITYRHRTKGHEYSIYTYTCRPKDCRHVLVTEGADINLEGRQKGYAIVTNAQFFAALVPPATQGDFATSSRLECAFVGSKTSLLAEMQASFAAPSDENDFVPGSLIDLLRPRNVYSFGQTFRSIIHSPASRRPPPADAGKPWCTIFDSTLGYLKWNHCYPASHQIILLDRAEANYEDSVNHLNQRYYQRPTDPQGLFNAATVQPGMTIISFAEATHD